MNSLVIIINIVVFILSLLPSQTHFKCSFKAQKHSVMAAVKDARVCFPELKQTTVIFDMDFFLSFWQMDYTSVITAISTALAAACASVITVLLSSHLSEIAWRRSRTAGFLLRRCWRLSGKSRSGSSALIHEHGEKEGNTHSHVIIRHHWWKKRYTMQLQEASAADPGFDMMEACVSCMSGQTQRTNGPADIPRLQGRVNTLWKLCRNVCLLSALCVFQMCVNYSSCLLFPAVALNHGLGLNERIVDDSMSGIHRRGRWV